MISCVARRTAAVQRHREERPKRSLFGSTARRNGGAISPGANKIEAYGDAFAAKSGCIAPRTGAAKKNAGVRCRTGDRNRHGAGISVLQLTPEYRSYFIPCFGRRFVPHSLTLPRLRGLFQCGRRSGPDVNEEEEAVIKRSGSQLAAPFVLAGAPTSAMNCFAYDRQDATGQSPAPTWASTIGRLRKDLPTSRNLRRGTKHVPGLRVRSNFRRRYRLRRSAPCIPCGEVIARIARWLRRARLQRRQAEDSAAHRIRGPAGRRRCKPKRPIRGRRCGGECRQR